MKQSLLFLAVFMFASVGFGADPSIHVFPLQANPYGCPRPAPDQTDVPLRTSFFFQLAIKGRAAGDKLDLNSLSAELQPEGGKMVRLIHPGQKFAKGYKGKISSTGFGGGWGSVVSLSAWFDSEKSLEPLRTYTLRVSARSEKGIELEPEAGKWSFVTEGAPQTHEIQYKIDLVGSPISWHGGFFTGVCQPGVNAGLRDSYEMMLAAKKEAPRAWSLQRVGGITGTERQPSWLWSESSPNLERDLETRRITAMEKADDAVLLRVEDFFGHQQYGISSNRAVSDDYKPGYEVLISDGVIGTRTLVLSVDDKDRTVLVKPFGPDASHWKIAYGAPLPEKENPNVPGLFAPGGCYLQRFNPIGTPRYYWGRVDNEMDLVHRHLGRRVVVGFIDIPGDLGRDGNGGYVPKDWAQYHEVVRAITTHLIERYGKDCYDFYWSVFNEPDLAGPEIRSEEGWKSLQVFYDYTVDAVLRAFEDKGLDSNRAIIGGLELGGIFSKLRVEEFFAHCSPTATWKGALEENSAYADKRFDGKRSKRVEDLCAAHDGKGSPMDFISIHCYDSSEKMAEKLIRTKEIALEFDNGFCEKLIVTSYECAPGWSLPPDPGASDSFLGNGYFSTWCADVAWRLLERASRDSRYGYGEQVLTRWPWPIGNFNGLNEVVQPIAVDDNRDGNTDRSVSIAMPVFHFLNLMNSMDNNYYLLPEESIGAHRVAGFISRTEKDIRVLLFAHNAADTQSRSDTTFDIALDLGGVDWPKVRATSYQIDKNHNTVFPIAKAVSERLSKPIAVKAADPEVVKKLTDALETSNREKQLDALKKLKKMGPAAQQATYPVAALSKTSPDENIRSAAAETLPKLSLPQRFATVEEVREAEKLSTFRPTEQKSGLAVQEGILHLQLPLGANGVCFSVITSD